MRPETAAQAPVRFERRYEDTEVRDLWELWTTKEGFESWWGPQGFRVKVHKLDARVGGELVYDMIATDPEQIEFMKPTPEWTQRASMGMESQLTKVPDALAAAKARRQ